MTIKKREIEIQKSVLDYLKIKGYFHWRVNSIGLYDSQRGLYRKNPRQTVGIPDIFVLKQGKLVGLEVKSATGRQSLGQKYFERDMIKNGGYYFLVRSIDDIQKAGL